MNKIFEVPLYPYARVADQDADAPVRHAVIVVGAGPVGLAAAIDLAQAGHQVVVLDDNDKVSWGSRAVCYAKRPLEILDRLGCGQPMVDKGVVWNRGRVFYDEREVYDFDLLPEEGHRRPAFINLQQYYFEQHLVDRARALEADGAPIELRGGNKVASIDAGADRVTLQVETPDGAYTVQADWVIACDGAASPIRAMENIFRAVNIALVNELKIIYGRMGIDIWEVIEAAKTKPFGYMPFYPGPGLGGHCIPIDPFYLTWKAREFDVSTRFIELAGEVNTRAPYHVIESLVEALSTRKQKAVAGSRILLFGLAYKKNVEDVRESPAFTLIKLLEERGAKVDFHDPFVPEVPMTREHMDAAAIAATVRSAL